MKHSMDMGDEKKREELNTFIIKRQNLNHMQELEKFQETFDEAGGGRVGVDRGDIAVDTQKVPKPLVLQVSANSTTRTT